MKLDNIEQLEVARSFSRKIQVNQYEPIELFASFKALLKPGTTAEDMQQLSGELNKLAVNAVEHDLKKYKEDLILNEPPF